jgi:hypothetical protein
MGKAIPNAILDLMLAAPEGTNIHVCSAEPTTYTEAITTFNLATDSVGSYVKAAGSPDGRQNTQAGTTATSITATGTGNHVAITTTSGSVLELVTTATPQALTSGGTVDIGSFIHTLRDPT